MHHVITPHPLDTPPVSLGRTGHGLHLAADGIGATGRGGRALLHDVTVHVHPGELVAVVGPSGAGKSTLLDVLAGVRPATTGTVRYDDVDVATHHDDFRTSVGYVPQDDIVHRDLDVRTTLRAATRLRVPDVRGADVDALVDRALHATGLLDRAAVRVGDLSGGQRKRACIAAELLTTPRALFLDEPTSGLDAATADELMCTLRSLATAGTTIVLTTHRDADLEHCDAVVRVAPGGRVVDAPRRDDRHTSVTGRPTAAPRVGAWTQWCVLARRDVALLRANRLTLAITLGAPVAVLAMFLVLFRPGAFDPAGPDAVSAAMITYWAAFAAFFFGLTSGLLQICTELGIVRRERFAGVGVVPYLLAKLTVVLPTLALTVTVLTVVLRWTDRLPATSLATTAGLVGVLLLDALAAAALGLLASAAVADPSHATLALPMICFPAVLFSGGVLPVAAMAATGRAISLAMPDRWAFEALGRIVGLDALTGDGGSAVGIHDGAFTGGVTGHALAMAGIAAVALVAAGLVLRRRTSTGRR